MRRAARDRGRGERGAIYVEFLIAFTPVFLFFLGLVQMAMLYAAHLVVQHSAVTAARAAIVVLDDDPARYNGATRNTLEDGGCDADFLGKFLDFLGTPGGGGGSGGDCKGGPRAQAIRAAASIPLLAISPSMEQFVGKESVYKAIGGMPGARAATGAALYNRAALAVTFPTAPGASEFRTSFGVSEDVTVRVSYLFHCAVPIANRLLCNSVPELYTGVPFTALADLARDPGGTPEEIAAKVRRVQEAAEHLERLKPKLQEFDYAEQPWLLAFAALSGARFSVVRAEATLPNHGASYLYVSEVEGGGAP